MTNKVCVTGASGYLAKHIVYQLLQQQYHVIGTVRSLNNEKKIGYLKHLQTIFPNQLTLVEADLQVPHSFDKAIEGVDAVLHTASPFWLHGPMSEEDAEKTFIKPAVEGTLNVLNSCKKFGVKNVVLTSSVAAVVSLGAIQANVITEEHWNTSSKVDQQTGAYRISKTKAEQAAWKFAEENKDWGFKLVTLQPPAILGPWFPEPIEKLPASIVSGEGREDAAQSMNLLVGVLTGKLAKIPATVLSVIDVRDIAKAHILSMQKIDQVQGNRFIISAKTHTYLSIATLLKEKFPELPISLDCDNPDPKPSYVVSGEKAQQLLGIEYRDADQAVVDAVKTLLAFGIVGGK